MSKGKYLHLHMAEICESTDQAASQVYLERALKKYKKSKKVWMHYQHFQLRQGRPELAKQLFNRSLQSLGRHKHIEVITKYASAEFDVGSIDRGRVVFEELLANYPKKTDVWHVYVDKEIKAGNYSQARQLFERMLSKKLNMLNVKAVFKKYLEFEKRYGTEASQESVKVKAREYVSSIM